LTWSWGNFSKIRDRSRGRVILSGGTHLLGRFFSAGGVEVSVSGLKFGATPDEPATLKANTAAPRFT